MEVLHLPWSGHRRSSPGRGPRHGGGAGQEQGGDHPGGGGREETRPARVQHGGGGLSLHQGDKDLGHLQERYGESSG